VVFLYSHIKKPTITHEEALQRSALSIREVSHLTGISESGLYRELSSGKIPFLTIGERRKLIRVSDYINLLGGDAV
jgi:excisionase family DNA binding protein